MNRKKAETLKLGFLTMTAGVNRVKSQNKIFSRFCMRVLDLHRKCHWGDTNDEDKIANDYAVKEGGRVISVYNIPRPVNIDHAQIWIITEADRGSTCILFPSEY